MRKVFISFVIILFLLNSAKSQSTAENYIYNPKHRKGNITFFWGWNRAKYTTSNIHFWGNDYNFTLKDVQAKDHQSAFDPGLYLGITNITIPQYNWRVGYYLTDKYHISVGFDHMKYVMVNDQASVIDGYIHNIDPKYDGNYANQPFTIAKDFLLFEHTDGLNYINSEIRRSDVVFASKYFNVSVIEGVGAGVLFPKTNCTLMHNPRNDQWHVSGFGLAAVGAVQLRFLKYFYAQSEMKGGYINMPDIRTTKNTSDKASQQFGFFQYNIVFGAEFPLIHSQK